MIPGIIFTLIPGPDVSEKYVKQGCLIRGDGHPVHIVSSDELFAREAMKLAVTAKPTQNIINEYFKKLKDKAAMAGGARFRAGSLFSDSVGDSRIGESMILSSR